jgi:hypothetical protein
MTAPAAAVNPQSNGQDPRPAPTPPGLTNGRSNQAGPKLHLGPYPSPLQAILDFMRFGPEFLSKRQFFALCFWIERCLGYSKTADTAALSQMTSGVYWKNENKFIRGNSGLSKSNNALANTELLKLGVLKKRRRLLKNGGDDVSEYAIDLGTLRAFFEAKLTAKIPTPVLQQDRGVSYSRTGGVSYSRTHKTSHYKQKEGLEQAASASSSSLCSSEGFGFVPPATPFDGMGTTLSSTEDMGTTSRAREERADAEKPATEEKNDKNKNPKPPVEEHPKKTAEPTKYKSAEDELKAIILEQTGRPIDVKGLDIIKRELKSVGATLREYLDDFKPKLPDLKERSKPKTAGWFIEHAKNLRSAGQPAPDPVTAEEQKRIDTPSCPRCKGGGLLLERVEGKRRPIQTQQVCDCEMGKTMARFERKAQSGATADAEPGRKSMGQESSRNGRTAATGSL